MEASVFTNMYPQDSTSGDEVRGQFVKILTASGKEMLQTLGAPVGQYPSGPPTPKDVFKNSPIKNTRAKERVVMIDFSQAAITRRPFRWSSTHAPGQKDNPKDG